VRPAVQSGAEGGGHRGACSVFRSSRVSSELIRWAEFVSSRCFEKYRLFVHVLGSTGICRAVRLEVLVTLSYEHPQATSRLRTLAGALLAVVTALALPLLGPAAASASLADDVAPIVPDAGSVTEAPTEALPDLPVPIVVPDVPEVPHPVPLPSASKPPASTAPPPAADTVESAAHGLGGEAKERVVGPSPEAEVAGDSPGPGAISKPGGHPGAQRIAGGSIGPAETAPLGRWRAYVWPAIALRIRDALVPLLASLDRFAAAQLRDLFGLSSPFLAPGSAAGSDLPSERSGLLGQNLRSPPAAALAEEGMSLLAALLIGLLMALGLVALARLFVGEELFEARHRRGHRS
jgi:hypothetical protein